MDEELARCKDLAARARQMAKLALREDVRKTLSSIADDYDRLAAEIAATEEARDNQAG